jgi:putative PIN family toxin of toxin-antitoxin system
MIKVVFDTVIFVRGLINPHSKWGRLIFSESKSYYLFLSPPVITEIVEVLNRPELTSKFKSLKNMDMKAVLDILSRAEIVEIEQTEQISRDVKDDKFLVTAHEAHVDYLVSEDRDLLDIEEYKGFKIITAVEFIEILEQQKG